MRMRFDLLRRRRPSGVSAASRRRRLRRLVPPVALAALVVTVVMLPACMTSCNRDHRIKPGLAPPVDPSGVPLIRVRITSQPVEMAMLSTTGGYRLKVDGRDLYGAGEPLAATTVRYSAGAWSVNNAPVMGRELLLEPSGGGLVVLGQTPYRGHLRLRPEGERVVVINVVDMESYLAGVLPRELYPSWAEETYRALAVAARTFALFQQRTAGQGRDYDLGDDQASQVYGGAAAETDKSRAAVRATRGCVLGYGSAGREEIVFAQYSSCCGGIVNGAYMIRNAPQAPPLLGGQACDSCRTCRLYTWPSVVIRKSDIYQAVLASYPTAASLYDVERINVASTGSGGRPYWLDILGPSGRSIRIRAYDLRIALLKMRDRIPAAERLYSMNCQLRDRGDAIEFADGHGFGHGVGLCQFGAEGKAGQGWRAEQILGFYYPGATIIRAY